jgi:F-type H+-transporting ATPase subunit epsilon
VDVSIVAPERKVWEGEADMVVARSPEGEFAILRGHLPFPAALVPGAVKVVSGGSEEVFFVTGGVLEASGPLDSYHVIVLADDARPAGEISEEEARELLRKSRKGTEQSDERAEAEMRVALASVEIAQGQSLS